MTKLRWPVAAILVAFACIVLVVAIMAYRVTGAFLTIVSSGGSDDGLVGAETPVAAKAGKIATTVTVEKAGASAPTVTMRKMQMQEVS